jgi:hypothetical protein
MYYPKLTYASYTIEGIFLFGILCLSNKIYGLEFLYYIGNFQIIHMEETKISHWETPLKLHFGSSTLKHGLRTPNEGKDQKNLKIDKICSGLARAA